MVRDTWYHPNHCFTNSFISWNPYTFPHIFSLARLYFADRLLRLHYQKEFLSDEQKIEIGFNDVNVR